MIRLAKITRPCNRVVRHSISHRRQGNSSTLPHYMPVHLGDRNYCTSPPCAPALAILARLRSPSRPLACWLYGPDLVSLLCRTHPMSIDWRFVSAVRPDDSAVIPSAPSEFPLQEQTEGGRGECASGNRSWLYGAGRTAREPSPCNVRSACRMCALLCIIKHTGGCF